MCAGQGVTLESCFSPPTLGSRDGTWVIGLVSLTEPPVSSFLREVEGGKNCGYHGRAGTTLCLVECDSDQGGTPNYCQD